MKMDIFQGCPVNLCLGGRKELKNGDCVINDLLWQSAFADNAADLTQTPMMLMSVPVTMAMGMMLLMSMSMTVTVGMVLVMPMGVIVTLSMTMIMSMVMAVTVIMIMIVIAAVTMLMTVIMVMPIIMAVAVTSVVANAVSVAMIVVRQCIHVPPGLWIENVEFGPHQAVFAYLARPDAKTFQPEGRDMFADYFYISPRVDQRAHKHVAANAGGSIEIEDFFHFCCSFSLIPMAILLIISA